jgi:hypothetical protein
MPFVIRDRRRPEPPPPVMVVARDRLIGGIITGLLSVITAGVIYLARTVPIKFAQIDGQQEQQEQRLDRLDRNDERQVTILEQHDKRLDGVDVRLTRMEPGK